MAKPSGGRFLHFGRKRPAHCRGPFSLCLFLVLSSHPTLAQEQDIQPRNLMGSVGMIDMPSARMAPDGTLSVGASFFKNTEHYNASFQVLPWLETSFRYSGLNNYDPTFPVYWDRSFAMKARLWNEGEYLPGVAVGINDLVGTGVYSGEYLVASKQFGPFDATMGIGWGRLATANTVRNPLTLISNTFKTRIDTSTGVGQFAFNQYFHGPKSGLFGGVVWHTPLNGLDLIGEFSSDAYTVERGSGNYKPSSNFNLGASYQVFGNMVLGLGWLYGNSVVGSLALQINPVNSLDPSAIQPLPLDIHIRSEEERLAASRRTARTNVRSAGSELPALTETIWTSLPAVTDIAMKGDTLLVTVKNGDPRILCGEVVNLAAFYNTGITEISVARPGALPGSCFLPSPTPLVLSTNRSGSAQTLSQTPAPATRLATARTAILKAAQQQSIAIEAITFQDATVVVYYSNKSYFHEKDAVDRLTRILMAHAPPEAEEFRMIAVPDSFPQREFDILRAPLERQFDQTLEIHPLTEGGSSVPAPIGNPILATATRRNYPRFYWDISPQLRQEFFDPSNPIGFQLALDATGSVEIFRGMSVALSLESSLYDDYNTARPALSLLPHVRTDFLQYLVKGKNGINQFKAEYDFRLAPTVFAAVRAGYLERMFAGVGGEVLWRPEGQRWALGADLYGVQQRDFYGLFGLQNYRTLTGHISLYYASPWYQLDFQLSAGQYLARDRGLTLQVTRRFATGVEIGAFVTKTNVSASQFGEGSFDKGILIRIPLSWILPINNQSEYYTLLRPVQRDGGQMLNGNALLYDQTNRADPTELARSGFN